jgi:hypothetical protein
LEGGFGDDDEVGAADAADVFEVGEEGDGLEGFAEALWRGLDEGGERKGGRETHHLVSEDPIQTVMVQRHHPVQTLQLVRAHQSMNDYSFISTTERRKRKSTGTHS